MKKIECFLGDVVPYIPYFYKKGKVIKNNLKYLCKFLNKKYHLLYLNLLIFRIIYFNLPNQFKIKIVYKLKLLVIIQLDCSIFYTEISLSFL